MFSILWKRIHNPGTNSHRVGLVQDHIISPVWTGLNNKRSNGTSTDRYHINDALCLTLIHIFQVENKPCLLFALNCWRSHWSGKPIANNAWKKENTETAPSKTCWSIPWNNSKYIVFNSLYKPDVYSWVQGTFIDIIMFQLNHCGIYLS